MLALLLGMASAARAQQGIVLNEILGSWRGDDTLQFVELLMVADGQQLVGNRAALVFDDATGDPSTRKTFLFTKNVARGVRTATILVATARLGQFTSLVPDLELPDDMMAPENGRVCYEADDGFGVFVTIDCVAYGNYTGARDGFGRPVAATPDNRSLVRIDDTGINRNDWQAALEPRPQTNAGLLAVMNTQCGDGAISLGEDCDGTDLDGATCASLGFVRGKLSCKQCHFDTSKCTFCGNGELNDGEQCDGSDLDGATCEDLGFTGGDLACTDKCVYDTAGCAPTFYVPGKGPKKKDCIAEWLVENAAGKPGSNGKAKPVQKCTQGDPGCDFDDDPAACAMRVAVCFRRVDARLPDCEPTTMTSWELSRPTDADGSAAGALLDAVATLGGTRAGTVVTFTPPLEGDAVCTATQSLTLPVKSKLKLKAKAAGTVTDPDVLTLICKP
jgi:hypothetical protein